MTDLESVRTEVVAWLEEHWTPGVSRREFLAKVVDSGFAAPTWPEEWYGKGCSNEAGAIVRTEFARVGAPGSGQDRSHLYANTLLAYGTDAAKRRLLRRLLLGEVSTCLLYSEPGAGSDLAAVQTRAERNGDEYVVNGQKVWTSGAATADYGMLVARTDWDVPKHHGITFFWLPMKQPGVDVRPIKQITGEAHFNEVFITDARIPADLVVGPYNGGWRVLQTALAYERSVMGEGARGARRVQPRPREASRAPEVADLVALAGRAGKTQDPNVRQQIARIYALRRVNAWNGQRAKAALQQGTSSPIMSLGKLAMSGILHQGAHVRAEILGAEAMLAGESFPEADDANFLALNAYFTSIGGGTDQIQRNIIGERVLGLPKEPETDRDVPFRDVPKAVAIRSYARTSSKPR